MIYFCTNNFIIDNTPISKNVEMTDVTPLVKSVSDMWIRDAIGTYFYDYLLVKYNQQTLTTDESNLVSIIKFCIAWRVCSESIYELSYQLKNKGLQTQSGDFSQSPEFKAITMMNKHYENKSSFYNTRLFNYLKENGDLYPEFKDSRNNDSSIKKSCGLDRNSGFNFEVFSV